MKGPMRAPDAPDRPSTEEDSAAGRLLTAQLCRGYLLVRQSEPDHGARFLVVFLHRTGRAPLQSLQF